MVRGELVTGNIARVLQVHLVPAHHILDLGRDLLQETVLLTHIFIKYNCKEKIGFQPTKPYI